MAAPVAYTFILSIFIFISYSQGNMMDEEFEGLRSISVEHSFDSGLEPVFTKRGSIVVRSLKNNKAYFNQNSPLNHEERSQLQELAEDNGIYRIRIPVQATGRLNEPEVYVSSFTKAIFLYESCLSDQLILNVDQSGEVLGIAINTYPGWCMGEDVTEPLIGDWNTTVEIMQSVTGPIPDTQTYIDRMKKEDQEKVKGQQPDNRSFLGKYWMYIVPFIIFITIFNSKSGGGGGGQ